MGNREKNGRESKEHLLRIYKEGVRKTGPSYRQKLLRYIYFLWRFLRVWCQTHCDQLIVKLNCISKVLKGYGLKIEDGKDKRVNRSTSLIGVYIIKITSFSSSYYLVVVCPNTHKG